MSTYHKLGSGTGESRAGGMEKSTGDDDPSNEGLEDLFDMGDFGDIGDMGDFGDIGASGDIGGIGGKLYNNNYGVMEFCIHMHIH